MTVRSLIGAFLLSALVAISAVAHDDHSAASPEPEAVTVRVAYTRTIFRDVHISDARASLKVWAETAARELEVHAHTEIDFVHDLEELARRFEIEGVDLGGSTMPEFLQLEGRFDLDPVFSLTRAGAYTVEYLLLVHRDSDVENLRDLGDADVRLYDNPQTSLALPWLDLLLDEHGLGTAESHLQQITTATKLAKVVLPVFFRQADACLVTRSGFLMMSELNPQVEQELRVIAESPNVIPMVTFLRRDFTPSFREDLVESICNLHTTPAGQQILNLMQADGVVLVPPAALDSSRELMHRWGELTTVANAQDKPNHMQQDRAGGGAQ